MSDPAEPVVPVVEPTIPAVPDAPAVVTEVDIPADGGFPAPEPVPEPADGPLAPDEPKPDEPKLIKKSPYQSRIDALTAQREQERREKEDARKEAALYKAMVDGRDPNAAPDPAQVPKPVTGYLPGSPEFTKAVREEAANLAAIETAKARTGKLLSEGYKDYKDFDARCNVVASLGGGDRADFMQIVTDSDVIDNGAKVIALLAENPEEAERILALQTVQMTAALVKFETEHKRQTPDRPLSSAPAPIRPIDGMSKGSDEPSDKDSMADYARKFKAKQADRMKSGQPARFARH